MTTTDLLRIKLTGKTPMFKELAELRRASGDPSGVLMAFCQFVHPGAYMDDWGASVAVLTSKGQYHYTLFEGAILKTNSEDGTRTLYTFPEKLLNEQQQVKPTKGRRL
ncbi:hypothetical protein [Dinghuibacter silviterrae]|uniref:Uncharacterized protein n=1 Tax=Dinghuibacter silviterrae TaxID=1539049 RepID=A0A4R8DIR2_9BACT|nr:hypothetical protein [Dinghuibacter silviterrae]TDW97066.1 hypothetical protein EDB95_4905 [Dinghuibacter silviterrae]